MSTFYGADVLPFHSDHQASRDFILDPALRNWVLIPIIIVMFAQGLLRDRLSGLLKGAPPAPNPKKLRFNHAIQYSEFLRKRSRWISSHSFLKRRSWLSNEKFAQVKLEEPTADQAGGPNFDQLESMMQPGMMTGTLGMIVPNMLSMAWVSFFFSGFVLVKLPFPLTDAFKPMLQRGIRLQNLDPSYVSSLSWYFLNLFGLRGVFRVLLGANNSADDSKLLQQQMSAVGGGAGQPPNPMAAAAGGQQSPNKPIEKETNELSIHEHKGSLADAETRLLAASA